MQIGFCVTLANPLPFKPHVSQPELGHYQHTNLPESMVDSYFLELQEKAHCRRLFRRSFPVVDAPVLISQNVPRKAGESACHRSIFAKESAPRHMAKSRGRIAPSRM